MLTPQTILAIVKLGLRWGVLISFGYGVFKIQSALAHEIIVETDNMSQAQLMSGARSWVSGTIAQLMSNPVTQQALMTGPAAALGLWATRHTPRILG